MTNIETKALEAALHTKRMELAGQLCGRVADLSIETAEADLIDRMQSMTDRDQAAGMLNRLSSTLADVDRSLRAISDGTYGVCAECEEPIALRRLQTIPWAQYCVRCQELSERTQKSHMFVEFDQEAA